MVSAVSGNVAALSALEKDLVKSASKIAKSSDPGEEVNLATEMTNVISVEHSYSANLKVVKTEDKLLGEVIDTIA